MSNNGEANLEERDSEDRHQQQIESHPPWRPTSKPAEIPEIFPIYATHDLFETEVFASLHQSPVLLLSTQTEAW
jgi:hypothetical protein